MKKNILIIGPSRSGKTTLSRKLNKELGYSIINLDDIILSFEEAFPNLGIRHDYNDTKISTKFAPFLTKYLNELSGGINFYNGYHYVVEGVYIDFEKVLSNIDYDKYLVIGLTYNHITSKKLFENIKNNDTKDDWTYHCGDEELKGNVDYFIENNKYFNDKFKEYNIKTYDVSDNREAIFEKIIKDIQKSLFVK
ncbi:MAG: hypothetical protein AB9915_02465 [Candidatus Dojkabacteria bacterium]